MGHRPAESRAFWGGQVRVPCSAYLHRWGLALESLTHDNIAKCSTST